MIYYSFPFGHHAAVNVFTCLVGLYLAINCQLRHFTSIVRTSYSLTYNAKFYITNTYTKWDNEYDNASVWKTIEFRGNIIDLPNKESLDAEFKIIGNYTGNLKIDTYQSYDFLIGNPIFFVIFAIYRRQMKLRNFYVYTLPLSLFFSEINIQRSRKTWSKI